MVDLQFCRDVLEPLRAEATKTRFGHVARPHRRVTGGVAMHVSIWTPLEGDDEICMALFIVVPYGMTVSAVPSM